MSVKTAIKTVYTYFFNFNNLVKLKKFGKNSFLGRRARVINGGDGIFIGDNVRIGNDSVLSCAVSENAIPSIVIEDGAYIGSHFTALASDKIIVGKGALLASYINLLGRVHGTDPTCDSSYGGQPLKGYSITVGEHTWIGQNVTIVVGHKDIEIGKWSIIGAGSVVTKSIPDYCIAVGNPAKVIKKYSFTANEWKNAEETDY